MTRLWGGRFSKEPAESMLGFTRSAGFDVRLVYQDCAVVAAHARALARVGILTDPEAALAADALKQVADDVSSASFAVAPSDEDVHTTVERALLERLPDIAPKIRAGLSRNDRVATAFRLWLRDEIAGLTARLGGLIETLRARSAQHDGVILPGYTHLQRAQPVRLSDHLEAHAAALSRDADRLAAASTRADASPLGAGALAGTTLPLDRAAAATDLGFSAVLENTLDAVSARDFAAEFLAAGAILGVHLSRLAEEIVLWTTAEFGFAELDDSFATGSSLMPQKRNPDVAELARGKSGRLIGNLTGLLATLKGLPLAYNRDLQEDKEPVFDTADTLGGMLAALDGLVGTLRFRTERMAEAASDWTLKATAIAERLVQAGVPFRDAHDVVGRLVALSAGRPLSEVAHQEILALHPSLLEAISALGEPLAE